MDGHFQLGRLTRKHGFKGNVVLKLDTDRPEAYTHLESFWLESTSGRIPFFIQEIKSLKSDEWVLTLEGIQSESDADQILGSLVWLPDSALPPLEAHQFYYHELVGYQVVNSGVDEPVRVKDVWTDLGNLCLNCWWAKRGAWCSSLAWTRLLGELTGMLASCT